MINLKLLSKSEYGQLLKCLSLSKLREPIVHDNKLWKRRVTGFSPHTVPIFILSVVYYEEIRSGNVAIEHKLISLLSEYYRETNIYDKVEQFEITEDIKQLIDFGCEIAKTNCKVPLHLILKSTNTIIPKEAYDYIEYGFQLISNEVNERENICNKLRKKTEQQSIEIKELNSGLDKITHINDSLQRQFNEEKIKIASLEKEKIVLDDKINLTLDNLEKRDEQVEFFKNQNNEMQISCQIYLNNIEKYKTIIFDYDNRIKTLDEELQKSKENQLYNFNSIINKLVEGTLEELKIGYDISKKDFANICKSLNCADNLKDMWQAITNRNIQYIDDIQDFMQSNRIDISELDILDDLENNITLKYVIVKALKSLFFEYLSLEEQKYTIKDKFIKKNMK